MGCKRHATLVKEYTAVWFLDLLHLLNKRRNHLTRTVQKENLGGEIAGFEYFYTNDAMLSEEKQYDLHLGQQLVRTTVCEYY